MLNHSFNNLFWNQIFKRLVVAATRHYPPYHNEYCAGGRHIGPPVMGCSRDISIDPPSLTYAMDTFKIQVNGMDYFIVQSSDSYLYIFKHY